MQIETIVLFCAGAMGCLLGLAALIAGVQDIGAVLCGVVISLAVLCLIIGWQVSRDRMI